ncbi:MAG: Uma2 family endonuclease [Synechococcales bacterium]|nr:Uma2 family endonuclease [Synechococcales bacterium]
MVFANRKPQVKQSDPPRSPRETLPSMYDLPSEDPEEPGLPDDFHDLQPQLLSRTLRLSGYTRDNWYTATDLNLYYDINHPLWHKRPDWFLAVDVPRLYDGKDLRRSYVIWQEGKGPDVVVEFLSPGTEAEDLGRFYTKDWKVEDEGSESPPPPENGSEQSVTKPPAKLMVYERYLRVPHYLVYSRYTRRLRHLRLEGGQYREQSLNAENPLVWLEGLEIGLGIWNGVFEEIPGDWLRWCDRDGNWFLTDTEEAQAQILQAAQNLLATGMGIDQVTQILGLSEDQVRQIR